MYLYRNVIYMLLTYILTLRCNFEMIGEPQGIGLTNISMSL